MANPETEGQSLATQAAQPGHLYIVATPIGNLLDLTERAVGILSSSDLIACENVRKTRRLLEHWQLNRRVVKYGEHNESTQAIRLAEALSNGKAVSLVSEAGTPCVSDPGFRIVRECRRRSLPVVPLPGPSAPIAALSASGLPSDGFLFLGFLSSKQNARKKIFEQFRDFKYTLIFFESSHRIIASLKDLAEVMGGTRTICVAREMTKIHETFHVGHAESVTQEVAGGRTKGEFIILIAKEGYEL